MPDEYETEMNVREEEIRKYMDDYEKFIKDLSCKTTREDIVRVMELIDMRMSQLIDNALQEMQYLDAKHPTMDPSKISSRLAIRERLQHDYRDRARAIRLSLIDKIMTIGIECKKK